MSDPCQPIRDEIASLEIELADLQRQLGTATPSEKPGIVAQIKGVEIQLAQKHRELDLCVAAGTASAGTSSPVSPNVPGLQVFGWEFNQGLKGYDLVAGKDTLVRIFVGRPDPARPRDPRTNIVVSTAEPPSTPLVIGRIITPPTLEFAILRVQGPDGTDYQVEGQMSSGNFGSTTSQSFSELDNVNFYLSGDQLSKVGQYAFTATFYRNGQQISSFTLGSTNFKATKDLRLLIVVENFAMTTEAWNALRSALLRVGRNFPIRSGVGPLDGDLSLGLRYRIEPVPMSLDFIGPVLNPATLRQKLNEFNQQQAALQKPDRADRILTVRTLQPGDSPGVGGVAQVFLASVVFHPGTNSFASLICQELGHTFGASVVALPSPHSPNATIDDPSAFDLLNRRSIQNPKPFMHNPVPADDEGLFEPVDWNFVRSGIVSSLNSTGPQ